MTRTRTGETVEIVSVQNVRRSSLTSKSFTTLKCMSDICTYNMGLYIKNRPLQIVQATLYIQYLKKPDKVIVCGSWVRGFVVSRVIGRRPGKPLVITLE